MPRLRRWIYPRRIQPEQAMAEIHDGLAGRGEVTGYFYTQRLERLFLAIFMAFYGFYCVSGQFGGLAEQFRQLAEWLCHLAE